MLAAAAAREAGVDSGAGACAWNAGEGGRTPAPGGVCAAAAALLGLSLELLPADLLAAAAAGGGMFAEPLSKYSLALSTSPLHASAAALH